MYTEAERVKVAADEMSEKFKQDYKHEMTRHLVN